MNMLFINHNQVEILIQYFDLDDGEINQIKYIKWYFCHPHRDMKKKKAEIQILLNLWYSIKWALLIYEQALVLATRGVLTAVICAESHVIVLSCPDSEHAIMGTCEATIKLHKTL